MSDQQRFIVVYKDGTSQDVIDKHIKEIEGQGGKINAKYTDVLNGFSASLPESQLSVLQDHPDIDYIEPDSVVSINAVD